MLRCRHQRIMEHTGRAPRSGPRRTRASGGPGCSDAATGASWLALAQDESDAPNRVDELRRRVLIDLLPEARNVHVDHVVERRSARRFLPDVAGQHLTRYQLPMMT